MEKLMSAVPWNRTIFLLVGHLLVTWRFWQAIRKSRHHGFAESVAAGGHLMLVRALRNHRRMDIPTYDPDQIDYQIELPSRAA